MIIEISSCCICDKSIRVNDLKEYKPRKAESPLKLCENCYEDFLEVDEYIRLKYEKMNEEEL